MSVRSTDLVSKLSCRANVDFFFSSFRIRLIGSATEHVVCLCWFSFIYLYCVSQAELNLIL